MRTTTDTVEDRFGRLVVGLSPVALGFGLAAVAAIGAALLVVQDPAVHAAMHDLRHAIGIVCH